MSDADEFDDGDEPTLPDVPKPQPMQEDTDPTIRVPLEKGRGRLHTLKTERVPQMGPHFRSLWVRLDDTPKLALGIAGGIIIVLVLALIFSGGGLDADRLLQMHVQQENGLFKEADATLEELADDMPTELAGMIKAQLESTRKKAAINLRTEAAALFRKKQYKEAHGQATAALAVHIDADSVMLVAESLRLLGRTSDAAAYYKQFTDDYADDKRAYDATFWQAEALVANGQLGGARELFERVIDMKQSKFNKSAARRLEELQ